jgi:hypothetical protein
MTSAEPLDKCIGLEAMKAAASKKSGYTFSRTHISIIQTFFTLLFLPGCKLQMKKTVHQVVAIDVSS